METKYNEKIEELITEWMPEQKNNFKVIGIQDNILNLACKLWNPMDFFSAEETLCNNLNTVLDLTLNKIEVPQKLD